MIKTSYLIKSNLSVDRTLYMSKKIFVTDDSLNNLLTRLHVDVVATF